MIVVQEGVYLITIHSIRSMLSVLCQCIRKLAQCLCGYLVSKGIFPGWSRCPSLIFHILQVQAMSLLVHLTKMFLLNNRALKSVSVVAAKQLWCLRTPRKRSTRGLHSQHACLLTTQCAISHHWLVMRPWLMLTTLWRCKCYLRFLRSVCTISLNCRCALLIFQWFGNAWVFMRLHVVCIALVKPLV